MYLTLTVARVMENEQFHEKICHLRFELVQGLKLSFKTLDVASGSISLITCSSLHIFHHAVTTEHAFLCT